MYDTRSNSIEITYRLDFSCESRIFGYRGLGKPAQERASITTGVLVCGNMQQYDGDKDAQEQWCKHVADYTLAPACEQVVC